MTELKNLGYVNGWLERPEIVTKCEEAEHKREWKKIGRCLEQCTCRECGYYYKIDSSG